MSKHIFTQKYDDAVWGGSIYHGLNGSSGPGSNPENCKYYIEYVQSLIDNPEYNIKKVVDIGCGDWRIGQEINWDNVNYIGIDCVEKLISILDQNFSIPGRIQFQCLDVIDEIYNIPEADLYLIKDVFQHWDDESIIKVMDALIELPTFRYILVTNCWNQIQPRNNSLGDWNPINPFQYPLSKYKFEPVLQYKSKLSILLDRPRNICLYSSSQPIEIESLIEWIIFIIRKIEPVDQVKMVCYTVTYQCSWDDIYIPLKSIKSDVNIKIPSLPFIFNLAQLTDKNRVYQKYLKLQPSVLSYIDRLDHQYFISQSCCLYLKNIKPQKYFDYLPLIPDYGLIWIQTFQKEFVQFITDRFPDRIFQIDIKCDNEAIEVITKLHLIARSHILIYHPDQTIQTALIIRGHSQNCYSIV